jgi:carbonic anhydrase
VAGISRDGALIESETNSAEIVCGVDTVYLPHHEKCGMTSAAISSWVSMSLR